MLKHPDDSVWGSTIAQNKADLHEPEDTSRNQGVAEQTVDLGRDHEVLLMCAHSPAGHDDAELSAILN
jgi:hypothetical protein